MTLNEMVQYHIANRKAPPKTKLEEFTSPPLLWADLFHIHDEKEELIENIDGRELTSEQLERYGDYYEFKPEYCGYDYTHHHYMKPQNKGG